MESLRFPVKASMIEALKVGYAHLFFILFEKKHALVKGVTRL
jgi:hypothetical protein